MPAFTLDEKVACLSQSDTYPDKPAAIEVIETHWSWVFLTPEHVYKLKKPAKTEEMDLSTLNVRHQNCLEEVRLNRRLAETVYIGVEPLVLDAENKLRINGKGNIVDWLVHMRRLPKHRMLDTMIRQRRIDEQALGSVVLKLCQFYREAPPISLSSEALIAKFENGIAVNRLCLLDRRYHLNRAQVMTIIAAQNDFLHNHSHLLGKRVEENRIIEAHGDLRPEHICLTDPPAIIDCLEFSRSLRLLDPVDELAYFSIECEAAGAPHIGKYFFDAYLMRTGDHPQRQLVKFYLCYRACVRARLAALHLLDDPQQQRNNWLAQAKNYLDIASKYTR